MILGSRVLPSKYVLENRDSFEPAVRRPLAPHGGNSWFGWCVSARCLLAVGQVASAAAILIDGAAADIPSVVPEWPELIGHDKKRASIFSFTARSPVGKTRITGSDPVGTSSRPESTRAIETPRAYLFFSHTAGEDDGTGSAMRRWNATPVTDQMALAAPFSSIDNYGPEKIFGLKGDPIRIKLPKPAQNAEAAKKLWEISERLTGAAGPRG